MIMMIKWQINFKNSLEMIDQETSKIIKDLKDFKEL